MERQYSCECATDSPTCEGPMMCENVKFVAPTTPMDELKRRVEAALAKDSSGEIGDRATAAYFRGMDIAYKSVLAWIEELEKGE